MKKFPYLEELILEEVYLSDDTNEQNPVDIFVDNDNIMYAVARTNGKTRAFKLTDNQETISTKFKDEILDYRIGKANYDEEEVSLGDIFMHGKYIEEIPYII